MPESVRSIPSSTRGTVHVSLDHRHDGCQGDVRRDHLIFVAAEDRPLPDRVATILRIPARSTAEPRPRSAPMTGGATTNSPVSRSISTSGGSANQRPFAARRGSSASSRQCRSGGRMTAPDGPTTASCRARRRPASPRRGRTGIGRVRAGHVFACGSAGRGTGLGRAHTPEPVPSARARDPGTGASSWRGLPHPRSNEPRGLRGYGPRARRDGTEPPRHDRRFGRHLRPPTRGC